MPLRCRACLAVICLLLAALPLRGFSEEAPPEERALPTDPGEALFVQGQEKETQKDYEGACELYQQVVERYPESASAPSALFQCAFVLDERLHDAARALPLYTRVITEYPNSRASKKAEIRGEVLAPYAGEWAGAYREFQNLLEEKKDMKEQDFENRMFALIEANDGYPGADQMLFFLARTAFKEERFSNARKYYLEVIRRFPGTLSAAFAYKGLGDLEFTDGQYAQSEAYYDAAAAYAEKLGMPRPSPRQHRKAHLYVARYRMLLLSYLLLLLAGGGFLYLWPSPLQIGAAAKRWYPTALGLLPLFGILFGIALYLLYRDDPNRAFNLTGSEAWYVVAAYALVIASLFLSEIVWPNVKIKRFGPAIFWTSLPVLLLAANYCVFYALDLVMYLESSFLGFSPLTGLPTN